MSRPTVSKAKTSYPIYSATFANSKPSYLVVGGGGGAGRHGVKNKITVFDFSSRAPTVESCAEIEASEDDSVQSLANLATKDGLILYAGINSSEEDRLKDKNEHFRAFEVQFPKANKRASNVQEEKTPQGKITFLSKTSLFTNPTDANAKREAYQRVIRLSPPQRNATGPPNKRIGAIASSLAGNENEVVVFSATTNRPDNVKDIIQRVPLSKGQEVEDIDILDEGNGLFQLAYCLPGDVFVQPVLYDFGKKKNLSKSDSRRKVYAVPFPNNYDKKTRPKIRCIRWLSPSHILLLANKHNRTGVELWILRLYDDGAGHIILKKTLPKHVKASVGMDAVLLDADSDGAYQAVVAVTSIDVSLTVLTIDYHGQTRNSLSRFHAFATYHNVHELQMTKVVFSPFFKPEAAPGKSPGPQYLRLATTSLGNSIDVETFELQPISKKPKSRYLLQSARSLAVTNTAKYIVIAVIIGAIALILQGFIDPEGSLTKSIIPSGLQNAASGLKPPGQVIDDTRNAALLNDGNSPVVKASQRLLDLLHLHRHPERPRAEHKAIVVHHDPDNDGALSTEVHQGEEDVVKKHTDAKKWEQLSHGEQKKWKERLSSAGLWAAAEGETILKGIFFGQLGGIVGHAAAAVIG
ncbi:hypothetical protein P280DRAFT_466182 [Massarina eburnea CBS 473.64]|uniref:Guanine nucleotide-exchange factor SEC12 n=1 Tax=Massarina eburnea CBS 473.64 TaxID=1395130 RepID=A0A6A6SET0_9PLEO|nr:hypothetical protein P280DRAFT_466182 [Massarina eburnea CBS 473.64]